MRGAPAASPNAPLSLSGHTIREHMCPPHRENTNDKYVRAILCCCAFLFVQRYLYPVQVQELPPPPPSFSFPYHHAVAAVAAAAAVTPVAEKNWSEIKNTRRSGRHC